MNFWVSLGLGVITSLIISKTYTKLPEDVKTRFENGVKLHHGEAGVLLTLGGFLTKSPTAIGIGTGFMYDDRKDIPKWFTGDKFNKNSLNYHEMGYA